MKGWEMHGHDPLIIIGAARSGTKLLRDLIAGHGDVDAVPYDVNYLWRLGNEDVPHDELKPAGLAPEEKQRILRQLATFRAGAPYLVEKTVSNCLRVPFVQALFPNALFLHLVRDGYDVVESAYRRWQAPPDWRYILRKARAFPLAEAPAYAVDYAFSALKRLFAPRQSAPAVWGPRYAGIEADLRRFDLLEVCAIQWARCVIGALEGLATVPAGRVLTIRYECFVSDPLHHLNRVASFLDIDPEPYETVLRRALISQDNVGKGKRRLTKDQQDRIRPHLEKGLALLDYA